jgi:hypothetical protein
MACVTVCGTPNGAGTSILSARLAIQAAGNMTLASARKPIKAVCQPAVEIRCCASGEARVSPKEPSAETEPMAMLRWAGETVLAVTLMAMFDAVHDKAKPTHRPMPRVTLQAEVAVMAKAKPKAYTNTPNKATGRAP